MGRRMAESAHAVFLSYASQDAPAAARICQGLRAAGIEVWFDQSELRGGEAWDRQIRRQIHDCALFIPVISAHTEQRTEGYFRREWRLAVDRMLDMADDTAFLLPVVIDDTAEAAARVPERFREVQWSRAPAGELSAALTERIQHLAKAAQPGAPAPAVRAQAQTPAGASGGALPQLRAARYAMWVGLALLGLAGGYWFAVRPQPAPVKEAAAVTEKSIAVLPFVDMSEKRDQEYFADGLAEELLDLLAKTPGLHVIARTSSFSFKGKSDDIPTIGAKLKVATILEGSVRRSADHLRVTTQLVRAADGEHIWSETYDRQISDIFKVQDEIAAAVATALKLKLAPGQAATPSRSANADAYVQYMLGQQYFNHGGDEGYRRAVSAYREALRLDPNYAAAYAGLAYAQYYLADATGDQPGLERAQAAAQRAIELAPDLAMGYAARADLRGNIFWDWPGARRDYARAYELGPDDPFVLRRYSSLLQSLDELAEAIRLAQRAIELDPFSASAWRNLGFALLTKGDRSGARTAAQRALAIDPSGLFNVVLASTIELLDHQPAAAREALRPLTDADPSAAAFRLTLLACAEHSLGHEAESQRALDEVIARGAAFGAYQIGVTYAWRGQKDQAFEWLERAYRQRDGGLAALKNDPILASLHGDARFTALLKKVNLAD
jgi:TolB-like protein/cytochrome c-type biogenesis protein CcmH/NrfG